MDPPSELETTGIPSIVTNPEELPPAQQPLFLNCRLIHKDKFQIFCDH